MTRKSCSKCGLERDISEFHKSKGGVFGVRGECKECNRVRARLHHEKNREKRIKAKKEYREANREKLAESSRNWRENNRDHVLNYAKGQKIKHRARYTAAQSKRRSAKEKAIPIWFSEFDQLAMLEASDLCRIRKGESGVDWQVDHMVPLKAKTACGLHCADNIQVIPAAMNISKHNRMILTEPFEWLRRG